MGVLKVDDSFQAFLMHGVFRNLTHDVYIEFYQGTQPTDAELADADIYEDAGTGWVSSAKVSSVLNALSKQRVRRNVLASYLPDNLVTTSPTSIEFPFSLLPASAFTLAHDARNEFSNGNVGWFMISGRSASGDTIYYMFTGTVTNFSGGGDMQLRRTALTDADFIVPSNVTIALGNITT